MVLTSLWPNRMGVRYQESSQRRYTLAVLRRHALHPTKVSRQVEVHGRLEYIAVVPAVCGTP